MRNISTALCGLLSSAIFSGTLLSSGARADQPPAMARVGVLNPQTASASLEDALRQGLSRLGYVEGKNIVFEWRRAAGTPEAMRALATDLVNSRVDLIVALGSPATRAALDTTTKPIVFTVGDPVGSHFAMSLAKPGGNATGVSTVYSELIMKHLEFLHELVPKARRIIFLTNLSNPGTPPSQPKLEQAAAKLGVQLVIISASNAAEIEIAIRGISRSVGDAVLVSGDFFFLANRQKIAEAIRKARLPAMFPSKQYHEAGVLMSYGTDWDAMMSQVATYVDRILKGAKPSELPIEQVSKYELVVDVRVARELGITIPQSILVRADEVIR